MLATNVRAERPTVLPTITENDLSAQGKGLEFYPWYETVAGCAVGTPEIMLLAMVVTGTEGGQRVFEQSLYGASDILQRPVGTLRRAMRRLEGKEIISAEYDGPVSNVHTPIRFSFSPSERVVSEIARDREEKRPCFLRALDEMIPLPSPQLTY